VARDLHVHSHPSGVEHWRHLVEIVALTAAAIWALYVFVYQEKIKPLSAEPKLLRTVTVEHTNLQSGKEFVKVNVELKNIGESEVQISAIVANLYGFKFLQKTGRQVDVPLSGIEKINFALTTSPMKPLYSFFDAWHSGGSSKPNNVSIEPGESWSEAFVLGIRPGEYDGANILVSYCYSHPTSQVWQLRKVYRSDGTAWLEFNDTHPGLVCTGQRSGLLYPL
jgi:hypothetical protein